MLLPVVWLVLDNHDLTPEVYGLGCLTDSCCLVLVPERGLSLMACSLTGGWGGCCVAALMRCLIVESLVAMPSIF